MTALFTCAGPAPLFFNTFAAVFDIDLFIPEILITVCASVANHS